MLFLMIIVLWRYLLSMALQREQDWSNPRATLFGVGVALVSLQGLNWALWLLGWYVEAVLLLYSCYYALPPRYPPRYLLPATATTPTPTTITNQPTAPLSGTRREACCSSTPP